MRHKGRVILSSESLQIPKNDTETTGRSSFSYIWTRDVKPNIKADMDTQRQQQAFQTENENIKQCKSYNNISKKLIYVCFKNLLPSA